MLVCYRCKAPIYRDEFKELDGSKYHTFCHRSLITERFERLTDQLSDLWFLYRHSFGETRAIIRGEFRVVLARYRDLSY